MSAEQAEVERDVREVEGWFLRQGLPFFVEDRTITIDDLVNGRSLAILVLTYFGSIALAIPADLPWPERILFAVLGLVGLVVVWALSNLARRQRALERPSRVGWVEVAVFVLAPASAVAVLRQDGNLVLTVLLVDLTVLAFVAAAEILDAAPIARWAATRAFQELSSLFRLVTRALPMLLLFTTFLFINTEVWQVASSLTTPVLWLAVAFFGVLAVAFLLARLPEEVAAVNDNIDEQVVRAALARTPIAHRADHLLGELRAEPLARKQRVNLLLVLLVTQMSQVVLLALAVWAFFLVFGFVAIHDAVIESWVGAGAPNNVPFLPGLSLSQELLQVSIFLAAFSGLYFTVYAVTDSVYREQFFTEISDELEQAVGVRCAYLALRRRANEPT